MIGSLTQLYVGTSRDKRVANKEKSHQPTHPEKKINQRTDMVHNVMGKKNTIQFESL